MKRKLVAFTASLSLLLSLVLVANVGAHGVVVTQTTPVPGFDRSRAEWFDEAFELDLTDGRNGAKPPAGHSLIARNNVGQGEFIFRDFEDDQRIITTTQQITESTDLDWFATTATTEYIGFLVKVNRIKAALSDPPPEIMISISTNQNAGGGNTVLPDGANVTLAAPAAWEYVIQTDFNDTPLTGNFRPPRIWKNPTSSSTCNGCEAQMLGQSNGAASGNFIEIKVPWSNFTGGKPAPANFWRFTVTSYFADHDLSVLPNDGFPNSPLIDAASTKTTAQVLSGGLDTYFDVHFDENGDVFSPLLITEVNPNPYGSDPAGPMGQGTEWIEIVNVSNFPVQLGDYSIGDATRRGSDDAMLRLPTKTMAPGDVVIVAQDKNKPPIAGLAAPNLSIYHWAPNNNPSGSQLPPNTDWSSKPTIGLSNTSRDQVVLTYGYHTIMDVVQYTVEGSLSSPFVGHVPYTYLIPGPPDGNQYSLERCPVFQDTNNIDLDFLAHDTFAGSPPTPGVACPPVSGVDLFVAKAASTPAALAGSQVNFTIEWSNLGDGSFTSVLVTDTLPLHLNFVSSSPAPDPTRSTATTKVWNFTNQIPPVGGTVGGTIIVTATLAANAPANTPLVNVVQVGENDPNRSEAPDRLENNTSTATVTAIKPDLAVNSTWPGGALPGATFEYAIHYANNGVGVASNVLLTDTLPASGVNFISSTPAPNINLPGQPKVWSFDDLAPGQSGTISVTVQLTAPSNTQLTNLIQISGTPADDPGAPSADNSESRILVVGVIPNLTVTTTNWPTLARPGTQFCYDINYAYPVGAPSIQASDIIIRDVLPPGLSLVSQTSTPNVAFNGATTGELVWGPGSLSVGGTGKITVCVKIRNNVPVNTQVSNVISISGSVDPDPAANDNTQTQTLTFDKHVNYLPLIRK